MRWRTQFGAVIGRLPVGRPYLRKWPFVARSYGRWCMYGPNYVKLSGAFAVRLFSMSIPYYTARATPGPVRALLAQPPCHHRLRSPHPHPGTATPTARGSNLGSGNSTTCPSYLHSALAHHAPKHCQDPQRKITRQGDLGREQRGAKKLIKLLNPFAYGVHLTGLGYPLRSVG
jgi:hypothetical protein